ncbi:hypothetical protein AGR13a_Cc320030 [Agrobacterium genomosp. 13 str. CFBP 6927]|uniref:Transposase n=1 Tax=Agrobacterium genomosp. 13 str. CFBP 6927 TaxID=1183428 RepID=A0ABP2BHG8_9HYPH|nr:hypothetical protein AGR13a_Cc320030 [Agrobacterium genomosp. 13 str. CFBP 6927]
MRGHVFIAGENGVRVLARLRITETFGEKLSV